jgi:hypothetical protein
MRSEGLGIGAAHWHCLVSTEVFFFPEEIRLDKDWGSGGRVVDDDVD